MWINKREGIQQYPAVRGSVCLDQLRVLFLLCQAELSTGAFGWHSLARRGGGRRELRGHLEGGGRGPFAHRHELREEVCLLQEIVKALGFVSLCFQFEFGSNDSLPLAWTTRHFNKSKL